MTLPQDPDSKDRQANTPSADPQGAETRGAGADGPGGPRYPLLWNNLITIGGMILAVITALLLLSFALLRIFQPASNQYVDIAGYLVLPGILVLSLVIMPIGILIKSWRLRRRDPQVRLAISFPRIDITQPQQQRVLKIIGLATLILVPIVAVSSYQGYHYTDSAQFCAAACHAAMEPEGVTHAISAHARIACAECHVGSGARWFLHYKLSGLRQMLAYVGDSYSRPIPVALQHLRPSRDTCEHCHWPARFFDSRMKTFVHFANDEQNSKQVIKLMLHTGGADGRGGRILGIHRHMLDLGTVAFIATDDKLQEVPWVKWTDMQGRERVYRSDGAPATAPPPEGQLRQMDCMDCHNRTGHEFLSGDQAVDIYMNAGRIDPTLPFIKREAMMLLQREGLAALEMEEPDAEVGAANITEHIAGFYRDNYADVWATQSDKVSQAADMLTKIYREEWFPSMRAYWREYPDNKGHLLTPGCFRCHDGKHVDQHGAAISHDCDLCHTPESEFVHPMALQGAHALVRCDQCHTRSAYPPSSCQGCHTAQANFIAGRVPEFEPYHIKPDVMAGTVHCEGCHDASEKIDLDSMNESCLECHDDEEERYDGMVLQWKQEIEQLLGAAEQSADQQQRGLLQQLRRAGPLHNMEATRVMARALSGSKPSSESD